MKNIIWSTGHKRRLPDIVKAENCYVYDAAGTKYIDLESGVWATSIGHCHPRITNVTKTQVDKINHTGFCYSHPIINTAADNILDICQLPEGKCEFLCSGSEAVEYGVRVAKAITDKPRMLIFSDSYFGAYGDATQKEQENKYIFNWLECSCNHPDGCQGTCEEFKKIPFEDIGIFLFEPGSSSGLVRFPSQPLIDKIVSTVRANNGMVVANEITTGIGRTGKWLGHQHYGFTADIVAMGKGLGNGYPVSAVAVSKNVAERLAETNFLFSQSHQNDPLGAMIANEVLNVIREENLLDRCVLLGNRIIDSMELLQSYFGVIKAVRGRGMMIGIELYDHAQEFFESLFNRHFLLVKRSYAEVLRLDPALTIEEDDIDLFLEHFVDILKGFKNR